MAKDLVEAKNVNERVVSASPRGDREGEYMQMERGRFDAWIYVIIAFVMQIAAVGGLVGGLSSLAFSDQETATTVLLVVGGLTGGAAAWFTFSDRWRCIEAFSSRFCSGVANFSLLYVPVVALVYANVRGIRKLGGR
jgi:hypothetical protein